ncbi:MAG: hypothetical protein ACI909_002138 [Planctomycetota bacterium]|jgi:hypothetical protein
MTCRTIYLLCALSLFPILAPATSPIRSSAIEMSIVADDGRIFPIYDVDRHVANNTHRAYLEAVFGENYAIQVRNNSNRRVGLVIAVDGRNIISGQKSALSHSERMYILAPWQTATYDGWRTSNMKANQFFFTDAEDSYAGAWQDHSAMGVIALAAFHEKPQHRDYLKKNAPRAIGRADMPSELESSSDRVEESSVYKERKRQAGTGFGDEKYSYAKVVTFKSLKIALQKYFYKYEWRETLCQKSVIDCAPAHPNRFWPEHEGRYGYVPYPPG